MNPTGKFWDRLRAAWFLFRYPEEFVQGIIQEFVARCIRKAAQEGRFSNAPNEAAPSTAPGPAIEEGQPGHICDEQVILPEFTSTLEDAALIARSEAANG